MKLSLCESQRKRKKGRKKKKFFCDIINRIAKAQRKTRHKVSKCTCRSSATSFLSSTSFCWGVWIFFRFIHLLEVISFCNIAFKKKKKSFLTKTKGKKIFKDVPQKIKKYIYCIKRQYLYILRERVVRISIWFSSNEISV